jgi:polyhydroxybutyrate depolymerase
MEVPMKRPLGRLILVAGLCIQPQFAIAAQPAPAAGGAVPATGCGKALAANLAAGKTVGLSASLAGGNRSYLVHIPTGYDPARPSPMVVNFHGFGSNPKTQNAASGFEAISDREGFVLVTPDGGLGWRFAKSERNSNTAYVRELVANVESAVCIDPKRVFAAGKSQGGFMSSWLGCAAPDIFAAVAPVAGMYEPTEGCGPIPIMEFHGSADSMIPFKGGSVLVLGRFAGAVEVMDKWAQVNRCAGAPETIQVNPHVKQVNYAGCTAATVQYITDAGHTWPGSSIREGDNSPPAALPASELIWAFFKAHPKT